MKPLIAEFVQTCPLCHRIKPDRRAKRGLLQPLPLPTRKWQSIAIDCVLGLHKIWRKGVAYDSILTVIDRATKMVHLLPTQKNCTAVDTAELLLLNVFKYHGLPRSIISDRDPQLTSQWWLEFCSDGVLQIDHHFTTAFHPQANGLAERINQTMKTALGGAACEGRQDRCPYVNLCRNGTEQCFHT